MRTSFLIVVAAMACNVSPHAVAQSSLMLSGEYGGNRYELRQAPADLITWHRAKVAGEALVSHLATLTTQGEDLFVRNLTLQGYAGLDILGPWIRGTDEHAEGQPSWITDERWGYQNWRSAVPNDSYPGGESYLQLFYGVASGWDDAMDSNPAYWEQYFVCEYEAPPRELDLLNGRFNVTLDYGGNGAHPMMGERLAWRFAKETGNFGTVEPDSADVIVTIVVACGLSNRWSVYTGGSTDMSVTVRVTDMRTRQLSRPFANALGNDFKLITSAEFHCL